MRILNVRLVPVAGVPAPRGPVDLVLEGGRIVTVEATGRAGRATGRDADREGSLDAGGRWAIPGLWEGHAHFGQWALGRTRLDLRGVRSAREATAVVAAALAAGREPGPTGLLVGFGHRSALWPDLPTTAALDAAAGDVPVVLVSGDAHHGWLSTAAQRRLGVEPVSGVLVERPWFSVFARMGELPGADAERDDAYRAAAADAAARGIVGVVDMEFGDGFRQWPERVASGVRELRVRTAVYPEGLNAVLGAGLRTGQALAGGEGLAVMGPLKVISDGSLSTRTAYCVEPYPDSDGLEHPRGIQNFPPAELVPLLERARAGGLEVAVHAIGDAAADDALAAMAATSARGSIEHAQLLAPGAEQAMARLGIVASVQPAHLLDDRDVTEQVWPGRADRCFPLARLLAAGVALRFGSDAPVSPLDPWLAMAAAVHRSADARPAWHPEQALTAAEALAASTDGRRTLAAGEVADIALLDDDPLAPAGDAAAAARRLREMRVWATVMAGLVTHRADG